MASRGFVAGPYVWSFNGRTIGISEDGWRLNQTNAGDPIRGDNLGDSLIDYVYRGGDVTIEAVLQEWDVALNGLDTDGAPTNAETGSIFWPWYYLGQTGQIGRLAGIVAAPLIGIPAPYTTAANTDYSVLIIDYAVLAPGYNYTQLFASRLRNVPVRLQALPWFDGDDNPSGPDYGNFYWYNLIAP